MEYSQEKSKKIFDMNSHIFFVDFKRCLVSRICGFDLAREDRQVARWSIESRKRQHGLAVNVVDVPEAFALGGPFDHFAIGPELDHTLVITHPSVENASVE